MKTCLKLLTTVTAALVALALSSGQAYADTAWQVPEACGEQHRVQHSDATCLRADWNNSPGTWSGYPLGHKHCVQNQCSSYGMLYAGIDIKDEFDIKYKLVSGTRECNTHTSGKVRDIDCCINHGDQLCYKNQVEKNSSGQIRQAQVSSSGTVYVDRDVSTHEKRWEFCKDNAGDIYCEVDPEGDANTNPYNCGDHYCTIADCTWHFEQSEAHDECRTEWSGYSMSISATDGTSERCTVEVACETGAWTEPDGNNTARMIHKDNDFSDAVWNFDDLVNCEGALKIGSC